MNRFENGFDSYQKAIVELEKRSENEFKLKAVIINFHHAIEVLFARQRHFPMCIPARKTEYLKLPPQY